MPETNDMTCDQCGGNWGEPSFFPIYNRTCRDSCHNEENWKALAFLESLSRAKADSLTEAIIRIADLEKRNSLYHRLENVCREELAAMAREWAPIQRELDAIDAAREDQYE